MITTSVGFTNGGVRRMEGYLEYPVGNDDVLEILWNRADSAFARIYHVTELNSTRTYSEIGLVVTYQEKADNELFEDHWRGECYLSRAHFSEHLIDNLGKQLLSLTECRPPFLLNVCHGERNGGDYREYGHVWQD